jgi:RimJ/RimL family protein N-acetyltransferase
VVWKAEAGNLASLRTAESVGFRVDGVLRQAAVSRGEEERSDVWVGSLLPGELREAGGPPTASSPVLRGWPVEQPVLTTARLVLRPSVEQDAASVVEQSDDEALRMWGMAPFTDEEAARAWLRTRASRWRSGVGAGWLVTATDDGRLLGNVVLFQVPGDQPEGEIGYGLFAAGRGRGYATEAVRAVTAWAFDALDLPRIRIMHAVENEASCGVAERAGFALEGVLRRSYRYGDGELHDEHLHARLADDPAPPPE